jgi:predicted RNA-binding Zn-ribbon protein involved in translation (DUF1610 family)
MGHKKVCLNCRLTFNRDFDDGTENKKYPCPKCGHEMILLPHRFRSPKRSDDKKWQIVEFYIKNGFYYQHIFEEGQETSYHYNRKIPYVEYPQNLRDAKEFVEKYKEQARKK